MLLTQLALSHYRSFRDLQEINLGRLTLLYGQNSSGKSAILRLPALLGQSMNGEPGLDLDAPTIKGASFQDLCWRGAELDGRGELLTLGLEFEANARWRWELEWRQSLGEGAPITIEVPGPEGPVRLVWKPVNRHETGKARHYESPTESYLIELHGLRPSGANLPANTAALMHLANQTTWLSANRLGPSRVGVPQGTRPDPTPSGGDWAETLFARNSAVRARVSSWYEEHTRHRAVLAPLERNQRVRLQAIADNSPDIPFPDVGEGLQQAFPVLVALEQLRQAPAGGILCVEEPESHLHPGLQRVLLDHMVQVLKDNDSAQILLETHSEVFLYAALLHAVTSLRGEVRLHWVSSDGRGASSVREVELDHKGRPTDDTLSQAFAAMGVLRREVIEARRSDAR